MRKSSPLWAYEDITAQVHTIRSALQLTQFIQWIVILFRACVPHAMLEERWMELALRITLSCSSRHYAGRSLQMIRALNLPLNSRWIIDILSRLVETVAENNDDMQGYVTEILLTLTHNIDAMHKQINGILPITNRIQQISSPSRDSFQTQMILPSQLSNKIEALQHRITNGNRTFHRSSRDTLPLTTSIPGGMVTAPTSPRNHSTMTTNTTLIEGQSTSTICPSVSPHAEFHLRPDDQPPVVLRLSPDSDRSRTSTASTLTRSRSAQNVNQPPQIFFPNPLTNVVLSNVSPNNNNNNNNNNNSNNNDVQTMAASIDDAKTVLAQLFWIGICLLESDYEYEFTLAVQLLLTVVNKVQLNTFDYNERIQSIQKMIKWPTFPGLQSLVLKGCTSPLTFESTMNFLGLSTNILSLPFVSTSSSALAMNVIALLPYMMFNYDNQHVICVQSAERIARLCNEHPDSDKLKNLETVMTLYAQGKFASTASQWAKCVLKYLTDVYMSDVMDWIRFLCEILDHGPTYLQMSIIDIFHHFITLIDTKTFTDYASFNQELVRSLCKYVNRTDYSVEITKILKLLIQRSSTLSTPKHIPTTNSTNSTALTSHMGKVEFSETPKNHIELPGRTLDIEYNLSSVMNIIKMKEQQNQTASKFPSSTTATMNQRRRNTYLNTILGTSNEIETNIWKQNAAQSQTRTRERLTALMFACGKQVGLSRLPLNRSASVVFSQTSDLAEQPPMESLPSSSKDSMISENLYQTIVSKHFDFLNDEDSIHEMFPIISNAPDYGDEDDGPMMVFEDPPIPVEHEPRRSSSGTFRNFATVGEWFDPNRIKSKIRGKLPFGSPTGTKTSSSRKASASDFTHMTDVVVDASRHSEEFTSAMDASTTTNAHPILIHPTLVRGRSAVSTTSLNSSANVELINGTKSIKRRAPRKSWTSLSREDMPETVPNQPHPPTGLLYVATMRNEDIEDTWQTHAKTLMDEINPSDSVKTFLLFRRLFKEIRRRLSIFVNETFHCLCMDELFRPTVAQFSKLLQVIMEKLDCTLVFVNENILNTNQILLKHRLILTEMNENYLNYKLKKKLAIECLDSMKSTMKLQSLGERSFDTGVATDQRVQMCKFLYNLFFQVITLAESYSKLVTNLVSTVRDANLAIRNLSAEFTMSFNNLNDFLNDVRLGKEDQPMIETNNLPNRDTAVAYIVQCLQSNTYANAVKYLRSARSLWPNSFGDEQNEVDVLLTIFYESLRRNLVTTNLLVILQQHFSIADLCHRLYEFDLKIFQSIPDPSEQHAHLHQTIRNL